MARIVSVYKADLLPDDHALNGFAIVSMAYLRWFKIADALARRGHRVELAVPDQALLWSNPYGLPQVALSKVDWRSYDAVKTVFHRGFETLEAFGGADHPCIISKLGSVVAAEDRRGIYFFGGVREQLYRTQERLYRRSRVVTVLNHMGRQLLRECHGPKEEILCVPGAADRDWPEPGADPYPNPDRRRKRILFAGNVYNKDSQPETNRVLLGKLNQLGERLARRNATLYLIGRGDLEHLDSRHVNYLGSISYDQMPAYFGHADAGIVVAAGDWHHNNESTKIYHYLRAGLPVVAESGFPNDFLLRESGLGVSVLAGQMDLMTEAILEVASRNQGDRRRAVEYILGTHTWDHRAAEYDQILASFPG